MIKKEISVRKINKYFYNIFKGIKQRCNCDSYPAFKNYGGRGIKCLWNNVREFYDDMYESYVNHIEEFGRINTSIERINNDGNYCKENCKWATRKEQSVNKTSVSRYNFNGEFLTINEIADKIGIKRATLYTRLKICKMPIEMAFSPHKLKTNQKGLY